MSTDKNKQLQTLLEKHEQGSCTQEELDMLYEWLDHPEMIGTLTFVSDEERKTIREEIRAKVMESMQVQEAPVQQAPLRRNMFFRWISWSAAAMLLIVFSLYLTHTGPFTDRIVPKMIVTVPKGIKSLPVTLPDGSLVWLKEESTLEYPASFESGARDVVLNGKAFFTVHPDKNAPFTVHAPNDISVRVLGTSFDVDAAPSNGHVTIKVKTGLVEVSRAAHKLDLLSPGQQLDYVVSDKKYARSDFTAENAPAEENEVQVQNATVENLEVVMNTIYHVHLIYNKQAMSAYRFNLSFSKDLSLPQVLEMLGQISDLTFEPGNNGEVIIRNK